MTSTVMPRRRRQSSRDAFISTSAATERPVWIRPTARCSGSAATCLAAIIAALDKKTGQTVWKTDRTAEWDDLDSDGKPRSEGDLRKAYSTPLIVEASGKMQMLTAGAKAAYSYDPLTGEELWKVHHRAYSGASRPLFGNGLAYINTGFPSPELWAVRVDGKGNVTDTHVVWRTR